jgi:hypothetical protein
MRDYVAEVRALVDTETARGPYVVAQVADYVVRWLRAHDPGLLEGFLHAQAEYLVSKMINDRDRSARTHARMTAGRSAFRHLAEQFSVTGDREALSGLLAMPINVQDNVRKPLADLTAGDLTYAADTYGRMAAHNGMMETFLRTLAGRVGSDTVADHYTAEQLNSMYQSLKLAT